nr:GNAT family N-acetyltransferase [Allobranchiibius sp. GilTou38]
MCNGWLSGIVPHLPHDVPLLVEGDLTLRAPRVDDIPRMTQACRDPGARAWLRLPAPYEESDAADFIAATERGRLEGARIEWAIEVAGRWVGNIGLHDRRGDTFEVGYMVHPDARGTGVCRRALQLLTSYACDELGLSSLTWRAARGNFASRRVAWACGFAVDGTWDVPHPVSDGASVDGVWVGHLRAGEPRRPRHPWYDPPVLDGGRFLLRPWHADDVPRQGPDEQSERFMMGHQPDPASYTTWLLERRERMAEGDAVCWCIVDPDLDEPLGHIAVQHLRAVMTLGSGRVSYWLYPSARGLGILQEALDLVIAHAFAPSTDDSGASGLGLHRLQAGTDIENRPSARALRRAGFRQVANERAVLARPGAAPSGALTFELLQGDDRLAQNIEPAVVPTLHTARLVLRPWTVQDRPGEDVELDRAALRYMPAGAQPTHSTWDEWYHRRARQTDEGQVMWCIADARTDQALGAVTLFDRAGPVRDRAEIGYWLYPDARGRGYAGEAIDAALAHGFAPPTQDGLGLIRIDADTDAENVDSQKLLRDRGFREWGHAHADYTRADGSISNSIYFELLAADYEPTRS